MRRIIAFLAIAVSLASFAERDTAIYRGKLTSDMNANGNRVTNAAPPVADGDLVNKAYVDSVATNGIRSVDGAARPLPRYLHALDFYDTYPEDAAWYYAQPQDYGSCSAVRDGGFLCRNYDWKFDDAAEFVVKVSCSSSRFASVGVANCGTNLTESFVTSGKPSRFYKCLPGRVVDGINENGVAVEVNVVDGDVDYWDNPNGDIHPLGAVRWVLDHATSALDAATNLATRIKFPEGWTQNFHWMIADKDETYIVEDGTNYLVTGKAVMTNFKLYPAPVFGQGWERYQLLTTNLTASITNVWFTRAYADDTEWLSEFADREEMNAAKIAWDNGKGKESHRGEHVGNKSWWQSVHTSIYNLTDLTLKISVQETDDWYTFAVQSAGGVKPDAVREIVQPMIKDATNGLLSAESDPTATAKANAAIVAAGCVRTNDDGAVVITPSYGSESDAIIIRPKDADFTELNINSDSFDASKSHRGYFYGPWSMFYGNFPEKDIAIRSQIPDVSGFVPSSRKINGQPLTNDITIAGMPTTGLVWNAAAGKVKTADGAKTIGAADVGALRSVDGFNGPYSYHFQFIMTNNLSFAGIEIVSEDAPPTLVRIADNGFEKYYTVYGGMYPSSGITVYNFVKEDYATGEYIYYGHTNMRMNPYMDYGFTIERYNKFGERSMAMLPQTQFEGAFAIQDWSSLSAMLDDAAQQQTRSAAGAKVMTLIDQPVSQKINNAVSANLNTYIDGYTGVEYVGKFYGGSLYYVPTGNVYPPNN